LTGPQTAERFNAAHGSWVYRVSAYNAKRLVKPLAELLEDIPDEPTEIAASHILIGYKGAKLSTQTRDAAAARRRAQEVLAKAKAPDADFAALAREYSDGPSAASGGDLGTFGKGKMTKTFEDAAWKLEVGEVSDVVETPFGFHVIKRTK